MKIGIKGQYVFAGRLCQDRSLDEPRNRSQYILCRQAIRDPAGDESPYDAPLAIDQDMGRDGNVTATRPAALMQQPVGLDYLVLSIAQDRGAQSVPFDDPLGALLRVDGYCQQVPANAIECLLDLSETSEFRYAQRSPVSAVKHKKHRAARGQLAQ